MIDPVDLITPYKLTNVDRMHSLVEHRNTFGLEHYQLNVFETRQEANDFKLKFNGFTITSMLRGKKIMHIDGMHDFEYVPGETVLAPPETLMRIDFPDAELERPTQCTALEIDNRYLQAQIDKINNSRNYSVLFQHEMQLNMHDLLLKNNRELALISSRMLQVLSSKDPFKEYQADLILAELILCVLRLQNLNGLKRDHQIKSNHSPFHAVLSFIKTHLSGKISVDNICKVAGMSKTSLYRSFTQEYGITPAQLILEERIKFAKHLLDTEAALTMKEIAYASGFNDPNYFSRMFRKMEGLTPTMYRDNLLS